MRIVLICLLVLGALSGGAARASDVVDVMLDALAALASEPFTAEAGRDVWFREVDGRSCVSCHTADMTGQGRHESTGKIIEPMAPSVNPDRLTDRKKINKWFLRNCKWTFGRECTAQEKGDVLVWLIQQ